MKSLIPALAVMVAILPAGAGTEPGDDAPVIDFLNSEEFSDYWLNGEAELSRFDLEQARYGELHRGDAVLIFEARDFFPGERVETDSPDRKKMGALPILKLNFTKKFNTGVTPYSIMTSVFTPLQVGEHPRTLASDTAVQEWSGQSWLQLDLRGDKYAVTGHSRLETGADESLELEATWLEDELWTRIRLDPSTLPTGMVRIVPGGEQSRLRQRRLAVESAKVTLEERSEGEMVYAIRYAESERKLAIRFEKAFPHAILGWDEWSRDAVGASGRNQTTKATRAESIRLDYRNRNGNKDAAWRAKLGLD